MLRVPSVLITAVVVQFGLFYRFLPFSLICNVAFCVFYLICIIAFVFCFCLMMQGGDVHALLCATGTRGVAVDAKVFQQRHGGVLGARTAGGSGVYPYIYLTFTVTMRVNASPP